MASVYRVANDRVRLLVFADDGTWLSLLYDGALGGFASFERSAPAVAADPEPNSGAAASPRDFWWPSALDGRFLCPGQYVFLEPDRP